MSGSKVLTLKNTKAKSLFLFHFTRHNLLQNLHWVSIKIIGIVTFGKLVIFRAPNSIDSLAALYCWALLYILSPADDIFIDCDIEEFGSVVEFAHHQGAVPSHIGHVGDAVLVTAEITVAS